jgi:hypothetical protein
MEPKDAPLDCFPFVGGDLVLEKRKEINQQKCLEYNIPKKSKRNPVLVQSNRLQQNPKTNVNNLLVSCYLRPFENTRVL